MISGREFHPIKYDCFLNPQLQSNLTRAYPNISEKGCWTFRVKIVFDVNGMPGL
ncbi:hypothetical protein [Thermoplasma acidophilum]|uniref:hypothetical protein n=1 Tax=Thermoplasma acidophilum TaxID=2303 RepID=UPI0012EAE7B0|nr:hypothetical protein [Thermoplasma acidophilum]